MKKIFILLLSVLLVSAALTACSSGNGDNSQGNTERSVNDQGGESVKEGGEDTPQDITTINMYTMAIGNFDDKDIVVEAINEISRSEIGVELNWTTLDIGQYFEQYSLLISGSEDIDIIVNLGNLKSGLAQGAYLGLNDLLENYGQGIKSYVSDEYLQACSVGDTIYAIPSQKDWASNMSLIYRADIVEELGLDVSQVKTLTDWTPIMEAVVEAYPDMYGYVSSGGSTLNDFNRWNWDGLSNNLGVLMDYGQSTEVVNLYETDYYKELLEIKRDWFIKGLVDRDTATSTEDFSVFLKAGTAFSSINVGNPGTLEEYEIRTGQSIGVIPITDVFASTANVTTLTWSIPVTSSRSEAAMKFIELMYTNAEISALFNYGIEGVHYEVKDNGQYGFIGDADANTSGYRADGMDWIFPNTYIAGEWEGSTAGLGSKMMEFNNSAVKSRAMGFVFDNENVLNEVTACENVLNQYAYSLEVGAVDIDSVLPEFIQALRDAGIDRIIEEKQAQLDAWQAQ